jgi:chromosome segregation protein
MKLKRVKIFGFKTFADRTEFDVDGDLIAVVGPNGCGKSNIVDAILWGLGEGNARHLRAQSGTDVIFNGSSKRKPLGYAEVSLLFDNEDGALPVPTNEVQITRRLSRNGDSEYSINRQPCRLRDILDLLADSGLGRAGYAIVGQKEIDQALAASAEDRRAWVDEAAGVQRYRARKIESLRRLASAKDHLSRVHDILKEIESQREPLREEAEVAKRFKSAIGALREVESGLLIVEVAKAVAEIEELEARIELSGELAEKEARRADELEHQARQIAEEISRLESEMDALRAGQQGSLTSLERADAAIKLGEQRLSSYDELESNLGDEAEQSKIRLDELKAEAELLRQEAEHETANFERVQAECAGAGDEAKRLSDALKAAEQKLESSRRRHAERLKLEAELSHRKQRLKEIDRELKGITEAMPDLESAVAEAQKEFDRAHAATLELEQAIQQMLADAKSARKREEDEALQSRQILAQKASLEGRRRGIEATIEAHEGLTQGSRAVLEAAERGLLSATYTPVGEAVEVDREYAVAIETALGGSANDLIVDDERDAKSAVQWLKQNRAGRCTFQPIPLMRPPHQTPELCRLLTEPGVVGIAANLVQCEARFRPVIESLLGRVLIVEEIDTALKLAKSSGWSRMVTLEGEVVHSSGAVTGGHAKHQSYGLVQRKADLAEIERQLNDLEKQVRAIELASKKRAEAHSQRELELHEKQESLKGLLETQRDARQWLATVNDELQSTQKASQRLEAERKQLQQSPSEQIESVDIDAAEAERDALLKQLAARNADAEQAEARLREARFREQQARERAIAAIRKVELAAESESGRQKKLLNLGPERERVKQEIEKARADHAKALTEKQTVEAKLEKAAEQKRAKLEASFALAEQAKQARANAQATGDAAHQAELNRARAESRRANAMQRLIEEYGLTEEEALQQAPNITVPEDAAVVTSRLRRELKAMGDVNVGAIEAYERLTERADELSAQKEDIEGGIAEVESSIRELDKLTRERFLTTFKRVEENFTVMFDRLFKGGEGKLVLTDPENLLESGIEVDVTLPGKKKQRLELLSGGERSLCATAFLFSLLKAKPTPLVVLDEVDAPLDGRNVERFIELLKDFASGEALQAEGTSGEIVRTSEPKASGIQFIVITHNPTTITAANVWMGVSMQEPGVSMLIPYRVSDAKPPVAFA